MKAFLQLGVMKADNDTERTISVYHFTGEPLIKADIIMIFGILKYEIIKCISL